MYRINENLRDNFNNKSTTKNYNTRNYNNNYSKESWQERQKRDRQECYDTMEEMAINIQKDGKLFQKYLDIQSRFEKYSVGNCLIILKNKPEMIRFREKKAWEEMGVNVLSNQIPTKILEPVKSKTNGETYFNPKYVYDITQTNATIPQEKAYTNNELVQGFVHDCFAEIEVVETLPNGTIGALYNKDENKIYACQGIDETLLLQTLSQEIANVEMRDEPESNYKDFKGYCISYLLCKNYGIDVSNYNFSELPDELKSATTGKEIRNELEKIRENYEKMNSRVLDYFEKQFKEKVNQRQER